MSRGPWLTAAFKAEVWRHWQAGETCSEIGRAAIQDLRSHSRGKSPSEAAWRRWRDAARVGR